MLDLNSVSGININDGQWHLAISLNDISIYYRVTDEKEGEYKTVDRKGDLLSGPFKTNGSMFNTFSFASRINCMAMAGT